MRGPGTHRSNRPRPTYAGWYARVTDADAGETFALIYGLNDPGPTGPAEPGWLMVLSGRDGMRLIAPVGRRHVSVARRGPHVTLGPGRFEPGRVQGEIRSAAGVCRWNLAIAPEHAWRTGPGPLGRSPMSWSLAVPAVETRWHVLHLRARITGTVTYRGRTVRFRDAAGYTETVWGRTFPADWWWLQAHTFDRPQATLCGSGGIVPLPGTTAGPRLGVIGWHDGERLHSFATHHGHRVAVDWQPGRWHVDARSPLRRLTVEAHCAPEHLVALEGPTASGVRPIALETLTAAAEVRLFERSHPLARWRLCQVARTRQCGAEVGGDRWLAGRTSLDPARAATPA